LNLTRSFCYWPDFHPEPDRLDQRMVERLADFLDRHAEAGMATVPTFIVGHMSGENWDPAWRQGRDLYGDVWMVARQAWFVRQVTERFAGHPAVAGWLLSNEMPIYGGPAPVATVTAWAELLVQAVRAGGGTQPVSLGDGAWGIEMTGVDNGFSIRATAPLIDFVGPHVYRTESDRVRLHLGPAFACELAGFAGRPVVLEEFGVSTSFASAANAGHYYRQVLHTSLLAGATGWIAWNNTDYDHLADQDPYRHHPFEMHFGLTDATGAPKPHLAEVRAFASLLEAVDFPALARPPAEAALVVPSYLEHAYPFTQAEDRGFVLESLRQAYVAAWGGHGRPAHARARRPRAGPAAVPGPLHQGAHRTRMAGAGALRRRRRRRLRLLQRRRPRGPAWPLVHRPRPDVRRRASAHQRTRRPHRG